MKEKEKHSQKLEFGTSPPKRSRQSELFPDGDDLPLFSGTPQEAIDKPFVPEDRSLRQAMLPGMPNIDLEVIWARDRELQQRRKPQKREQADDLFTYAATEPSAESTQPTQPIPEEIPLALKQRVAHQERRRPRRQISKNLDHEARHLRDALGPYLSVNKLRRLASDGTNLYEALTSANPPPEVLALLDLFATLLRPIGREQVTNPADIAALLMVEMGHLSQEQLRVVCLNTKNFIQKIQLVYQGSVNNAQVRIGEIFREPLRLNSTSIIVAHNHPSNDPTPSPEDVAVTRQIVEAGGLLGVEVLDHIVIGQGRWVSLRERRLGFST